MWSIFGPNSEEQAKARRRLSLVANICGIGSFFASGLGAFVRWDPVFSPVMLLVAILIAFALLALHLGQRVRYADSKADYELRITSVNGDCWVQRESTFVNKSGGQLSGRRHTISSTGEPMDSDQMELKAWDNGGNVLSVRFFSDRPTEKEIDIQFARNLGRNDSYNYGYKYFWNRLFPDDEETFTCMDVSPIVNFTIKIDTPSLRIDRLVATEKSGDGSTIPAKELDRHASEVNHEYRLRVIKADRFSSVIMLINLRRTVDD